MTLEAAPKKKIRPLWIVLGMVGACAACCAVPIVMLLMGGATLAGTGVALSPSWDTVACGALMLIVVGAALLLVRPRRPAPSCSVDGTCGCKEKA